MAGVSRERPDSNHTWATRLRLPYPLLSDEDGAAARALGVVRPFGIGGWTVDLTRRTTFLVDRDGTIAAVWTKVKLRGHASEVLRHSVALLGASRRAEGPVPRVPPAGPIP